MDAHAHHDESQRHRRTPRRSIRLRRDARASAAYSRRALSASSSSWTARGSWIPTIPSSRTRRRTSTTRSSWAPRTGRFSGCEMPAAAPPGPPGVGVGGSPVALDMHAPDRGAAAAAHLERRRERAPARARGWLEGSKGSPSTRIRRRDTEGEERMMEKRRADAERRSTTPARRIDPGS